MKFTQHLDKLLQSILPSYKRKRTVIEAQKSTAETYASYAYKHQSRVEQWAADHPSSQKLPIIFSKGEPIWLNRKERRLLMKGNK